MNRVAVLFIVTVVLIGGVIWGYSDDLFGDEGRVRRTEKPQVVVEPLPEIDRNRVQTIEISDASGKVSISRKGEGWILPDLHGGPAMVQRVTNLLDSLDTLARGRKVASKNHRMFDLEEAKARHLRLLDDTGAPLLDVLVGKQDQPRGRDPKAIGTYLRRPGKDAIFKVRGRLVQNLNTGSLFWLERRVLNEIENTQINEIVAKAKKVILEFDDIQFTPARPGAAPESQPTGEPARLRCVLERREAAVEETPEVVGPTPPGAQPPKPKEGEKAWEWKFTEPAAASDIDVFEPAVQGVTRALLYLRMDAIAGKDPADARFGLDEPVLDLTVHFGDSSYNLKVGKEVPKEERDQKSQGYVTRYAHMAGSPYVVTINQYVLAQLAKKPEGFKKPAAVAPLPVKPKIALPPKKAPIPDPDKAPVKK